MSNYFTCCGCAAFAFCQCLVATAFYGFDFLSQIIYGYFVIGSIQRLLEQNCVFFVRIADVITFIFRLHSSRFIIAHGTCYKFNFKKRAVQGGFIYRIRQSGVTG